MSEMMYALVKKTAGVGLVLEKVPVPMVGINDVKIKIKRTAICGTDLHIYNWDEWSQKTIKTPMTIGHEFVGEIVEMGDNVIGMQKGDIVSGEGHIVCDTCRNCLAGKRHLCKNTVGVGVNRNGAFAEYLVIPQKNVVKVQGNIPLDVVACFDPLGNAVHTALSFDLIGEDVLISGAGPIGIMAAAICRHVGARHIAITDINDARLELAKELCKDIFTINVTRDNQGIPEAMKALGMREGFDVGLEMSGNPSAFRAMVDNINNGGKIALLGIQSKKEAIDWDKVVFNGITIKGIYGREMFETWYKMMAMVSGGLNIEKLITHHFDFKDFDQGFAAMNSGKSGKVILNWE